MTAPVYLAGRGLACALGLDLASSVKQLQAGGVAPETIAVGGGLSWPYFSIPFAHQDWYARARHLCCQVVAESGADNRDAPLFFASCSQNIGALESGEPAEGDCLSFAEQAAHWLDWRGPVYWISTACTSASNAVLAAVDLLRAHQAEQALVLGVELHNRFTCAGFGAMQLLDSERPRPLAANRAGLVLGEAISALWLSRVPSAWRIAGGANVVDGQDPAGASPQAVAHMARQALTSSGVAASEIDLIKLQAAGSPGNDAAEISGLREVFLQWPALLTLKAELGHTLGASGAAELALLTGCIEQACFPALRHATDPALAIPPTVAVPARPRYLMSTILGFGGGHSTLILEHCA